jgi:hypothetical protein
MLSIVDHTTIPLDRALVIFFMRISRPLSMVNSIQPFLLAPFCALSFFLATPGLSYGESSIEFLILLPEDLH